MATSIYMAYQFVREPLNGEECDRLVNACRTFREQLVVWVLLDTGLRVKEFCSLRRDQVQWQENALVVWGKGGPYGKRGKRRMVPLIDQAHRLMHLWRAGDLTRVDHYLDDRALRRNALCAQLLQALIELAPAGSDKRSLLESISNHLVARGRAPGEEKTLLDTVGETEESQPGECEAAPGSAPVPGCAGTRSQRRLCHAGGAVVLGEDEP